MDDLKSLANKHRELDFLIEGNKNLKPFISDWNCEHPFYKEETETIKVKPKNLTKYNYIRGEDDLTELISEFHLNSGEPKYSLDEILTSHGSTTIISAFFIWLKSEGIKEVYYIPPIYFTFHFFASIYDISFRPVTKSHLFESNPQLNLPNKKSVLVLTDPIWYCGFIVPETQINFILKWQERTKSTVFVDGSFQYFKWDCSKHEHSSIFIKDRTFRLVCPTKTIAIHGLRFSYLLLPKKLYNTFDFILDNLMGSSNPYDVEFSKKCMKILCSKKNNIDLIKYTHSIFHKLQDKQAIFTEIQPNCGYFVFAIPCKKNNSFDSMDGNYFEQQKYEKHVRINLLGSKIKKLF
ncbi:MAG TPA: aminotransferase class I/II-fold pyridoxal phosphate-dependent enzyme [Bacteroidia bacterium]|jgi:aspartate/methionine/tyrosine aminotransferase|nr:aminotransferase class I/II-fold pyridoxal phosphate-dependent enzyme [Bacteroidia bacterium]